MNWFYASRKLADAKKPNVAIGPPLARRARGGGGEWEKTPQCGTRSIPRYGATSEGKHGNQAPTTSS